MGGGEGERTLTAAEAGPAGLRSVARFVDGGAGGVSWCWREGEGWERRGAREGEGRKGRGPEDRPVGEEDIAGVDICGDVAMWMGSAVVCLLGGLLRRGWGRVFRANKVGMYGKITLGLGLGLDFGEK